jgi:CRP-like cAMP-binding protein
MLLDLSKLETKFETLNFDKGEVLFRQGEINGDGFILKSGVVGLTREMEGQ